jgi:hypothetical protein
LSSLVSGHVDNFADRTIPSGSDDGVIAFISDLACDLDALGGGIGDDEVKGHIQVPQTLFNRRDCRLGFPAARIWIDDDLYFFGPHNSPPANLPQLLCRQIQRSQSPQAVMAHPIQVYRPPELVICLGELTTAQQHCAQMIARAGQVGV